MAGGGWDGLIQSLRRNGLDIVVAFDSTGSMGGEIRQVKGQIGRIGSTLVKLVPKARISIATYRDDSDSYVVKGLPLTNDIEQIDAYLRSITAGGGGDHPEAVHEGLSWSVDKNEFRPKARKVILLFGDAPPHPQFLSECLSTVSDFRGQQNGIVSTVTCRSSRRIPEFIEIAQTGGGEAFLTADERQIMTQLLVLVFGSRHRAKVMEAFDLLGR
jgi:Mg-chelatase subunit ChlD